MSGTDTQPLFGETRRRDKIINIVIAIITAIIVGFTVLMGIVSSVFIPNHEKCLRLYGKDDVYCVYPVDIVFCVLVIMLLLPQIIVAYWYRRGELEPKFRTLIYYNAVVTILLCICGNLYFFQIGFEQYNPPPTSPPTTTRLS